MHFNCQVIDSNMLSSARLESFLSAKPTNMAVLADYAAMEAYKPLSTNGIIQSTEILCRHPRQVIVLKCIIDICGLRGTEHGIRSRMIDRTQTAEFSKFCGYTHLASLGNRDALRAIERKGEAARAQIKEICDSAPAIAESRKLLSHAFSASDIKAIRTDKPTEHLLENFSAQVCLLAAIMFRSHPRVRKVLVFDAARNRFIFRLALCIHLWTLEWIRTGSAPDVSENTIRNDMIDLYFLAYATYFDGIMSEDQKTLRLFSSARQVLRGIQRA